MINPFIVIRKFYRYRAPFAVYIFIGGISAIINWTIFYVFYNYLDYYYVYSAVAAFLGATAVNYFLSERFGFLSGDRSRTRLVIGVYVVSCAGLSVDILALWALYGVLGINVMGAKVIGTAAAFFVNFGGRQFFVFTRHPRWPSLSALGRTCRGV